jgi:hypothetical protein
VELDEFAHIPLPVTIKKKKSEKRKWLN